MAITYADLAQKLQKLEAQYGGNSTQSYKKPAKDCVFQPSNYPSQKFIGPNLQYYALDNSNSSNPDAEMEVVICIGMNYTQCNCPGTSPFPLTGGATNIQDNLRNERNTINSNFNCYYSMKKSNWFNLSASSSKSITLPDNYHLVLTNYSPWITVDSWQNIRPHKRAEILMNPPHGKGPFAHIHNLISAINKNGEEGNILLFIGHGIGSESFSFFRILVAASYIPWILFPNIAFRLHGSSKFPL